MPSRGRWAHLHGCTPSVILLIRSVVPYKTNRAGRRGGGGRGAGGRGGVKMWGPPVATHALQHVEHVDNAAGDEAAVLVKHADRLHVELRGPALVPRVDLAGCLAPAREVIYAPPGILTQWFYIEHNYAGRVSMTSPPGALRLPRGSPGASYSAGGGISGRSSSTCP
jgi:hypothetical protein